MVSLFGGSRLQIAGPTGAFIAILAGITATYGIDGLQVATLVAVQALPVDGKANQALLLWLAKTLGMRAAQIYLVSGQASRDKRVRIEGVEAARIRAALGAGGQNQP